MSTPIYHPGDRVLVKTGIDNQTYPRMIVRVVTENREVPGYLMDETVSTSTGLLAAQKMNGYYQLYPNTETRYAEEDDLIPCITDVTQYMLKMLPLGVQYENTYYRFSIFRYDDGITLQYKSNSGLYLFLHIGLQDDVEVKISLLKCRRFLEEKRLLP